VEGGPVNAATRTPSSRPGARPAQAAQPAFVLHRYDWSETSLILDLFTRDSGRVAAAAKGAKRPTSQLRSVLMPFQRIQVQFARPRGGDEVRTLRAAEWAGQGPLPDGAALFAGFHLNELLMRLLARDDPHPRLFDAYAQTLRALGRGGPGALESVLRAFELVLLRATGVLPQLDRVTATQVEVAPERWYSLRPEQGLVDASPGDSALPGAACAALEGALQAMDADPSADAFEHLWLATGVAAGALKSQLRQQLHYHLSGATLRTRQVMVDTYRLLGLDASATPR
jgi:DNA repair protein RecO (recombination protein O)